LSIIKKTSDLNTQKKCNFCHSHGAKITYCNSSNGHK
jgi:hypothetical protein